MNNNEMTTNEVIKLLLNKEMEINNKIINVVSELLRLGYESDRGKQYVKDLRGSIEYTLDDIERILNRSRVGSKGKQMENYMNSPIARQWTDQDIINEYQRCQDKKQVAKIYLISVKEVTEILKRNK